MHNDSSMLDQLRLVAEHRSEEALLRVERDLRDLATEGPQMREKMETAAAVLLQGEIPSPASNWSPLARHQAVFRVEFSVDGRRDIPPKLRLLVRRVTTLARGSVEKPAEYQRYLAAATLLAA